MDNDNDGLQYLNMVAERAGAPTYSSLTMENVKQEKRFEMFEEVRLHGSRRGLWRGASRKKGACISAVFSLVAYHSLEGNMVGENTPCAGAFLRTRRPS